MADGQNPPIGEPRESISPSADLTEIPRAEIILEPAKIVELPPFSLVVVQCPSEIIESVQKVFDQVMERANRKDVTVLVLSPEVRVQFFSPAR